MFAVSPAVWLLWCGLCLAVPDTQRPGHTELPDTWRPGHSDLPDRQQKIQDLMRSLQAYSAETHAVAAVLKNHTSPDPPRSLPPFHSSFGNRTKSTEEQDRENLLPEDKSIKSYEDYYRTFYGTREGVSLLRKQYGPEGLQEARAKFPAVNKDLQELRLANQHFLQVRQRAPCRLPLPQLVRVQDLHPDPSRDFRPRCTWLHRCGPQAGCCDSDAFRCAPAAVQEVTLYFHVMPVSRFGVSPHRTHRVDRLLFENHTRCECQPLNPMPRMQEHPTTALLDRDQLQKVKCGDCPVPFSMRVYGDGRCGCDCFDRQRPCLRVKRGRDPLSSIERRCVEANHCRVPDCEHGPYDVTSGQCPRRHDEDKPPIHHPRKTHHHTTHRWSFHERD